MDNPLRSKKAEWLVTMPSLLWLSPEMLDKEQLVPPEEQQRRAEMKAEKQRAEEVNRLAEEIKRLAKKAKDLGEEAKAQKNNQAETAKCACTPQISAPMICFWIKKIKNPLPSQILSVYLPTNKK